MRQGLAELSRHQAQFGSLDLQTAGAVHGRRLVALDLRLALAAGRPAGLFNAIERGRAVSRRLTAVTPPADESGPALAELRQVTETLRAIGDDPAERARRAMRRRSAALYASSAPSPGAPSAAARWCTRRRWSAVAEAVAAQGKVLVSYCQVEGRWSAVVLGGGRPRLVDLPGGAETVELSRRAQADLDVLAWTPCPERCARRWSGRWRTLAALDERLVRPLRLGDQALVVVPTGPTATLPWTCLPSLRGRPVEVSPTATSWLAGSRGAAGASRCGWPPSPDRGWPTPPPRPPRWPPAGRPRRWRRRGGRRRDPGAADDELATATVVHVAAHGTHERQNPLFSSLQLVDGALFAYEVAAPVAPHVVLSACELGQATTRPGDEALGWTRVLLQLGARCVVAGVSQVADERAREVMVDYHRRLAGGEDAPPRSPPPPSTGRSCRSSASARPGGRCPRGAPAEPAGAASR